MTCTSESACQKCVTGYILSDSTCEEVVEAKRKNPILIYASTSIAMAVVICTLSGIIMNCVNSPKSVVSESIAVQREDDVSKLINLKSADTTPPSSSSTQLRLKDAFKKRQLRNSQGIALDLTSENSPGLSPADGGE